MSINLSPHEKKILSLVDKYPSIIDDPLERKRIAELNGMSEKTLRNRLADLKRYGIIGEKNRIQNYNNIDEGFIGNFLLFWNNRKFILKNVNSESRNSTKYEDELLNIFGDTSFGKFLKGTITHFNKTLFSDKDLKNIKDIFDSTGYYFICILVNNL